jgi:hypothetical protein
VWGIARRHAGVESSRHGDVWLWSLPATSFEQGFAVWLETPAGRFAVYCAERDRLASVPTGVQLMLDTPA